MTTNAPPSAVHSPRIPPGYKQTEVGVIPVEWDGVQLASITPLNRKNGIVDGPFGSNLKTIHYRKSGIPIITSGYVTDGVFYAEKYLYVDPSKFREEKRSAVQPGDIVMAKIGERCGASAILPPTHETGILSGNALKITVDETRHSTAYVWQVLWNLHASGKLMELRTVGAQPALSMASLKRFKIPVPPTKAEQRAIAEALSDVDALLATLDRLIAKKRDLKQAAMQQLLTGQSRLPGFQGGGTKRLGDVVEPMVGGGTPSRSNPVFWGDEIPWVTVKDFATFNPRKSQESITKVGLKNSASHLIPAGTLITSTRMALGKAVVYDVDVAIDQDLKALFLKPTADRLFVYYWFEANAKVIDDLGSGSTVKGISIAQLKSVPFPVTPLPEQTAIAEVLSDMDAELAALEQRRDKTRAIKQGMMQELLTGRTIGMILSPLNKAPLSATRELISRLSEAWIAIREADFERNKRENHHYNPLRAITIKETDHSRILGELLNPHGSHGQGAHFLDSFLKRIGIDPVDGKWKVTVESDRVDILLRRENPCSIVIIENKSCNATDQSGQLYRYWYEQIHQRYPDLRYDDAEVKKNFRIVYLTPCDFSRPHDTSLLQPREPVYSACAHERLPNSILDCLSFETHVADWLNELLALNPGFSPRLRTFLELYAQIWRL